MSFKKWRDIESVSTKNRPILISIAQFHFSSRKLFWFYQDDSAEMTVFSFEIEIILTNKTNFLAKSYITSISVLSLWDLSW